MCIAKSSTENIILTLIDVLCSTCPEGDGLTLKTDFWNGSSDLMDSGVIYTGLASIGILKHRHI